jgi:hypothetical protein
MAADLEELLNQVGRAAGLGRERIMQQQTVCFEP